MEGPGLGKGGPKIHWELTTRLSFITFIFHFYHNNKDTVKQNSNRPTIL